jgi:hypothetical protein
MNSGNREALQAAWDRDGYPFFRDVSTTSRRAPASIMVVTRLQRFVIATIPNCTER